jgi:hypothetical protein
MADTTISGMPPAAALTGSELVPVVQSGANKAAQSAAFGVPISADTAPTAQGQYQIWINTLTDPPTLNMWVGAAWVALYTLDDGGNIAFAMPLTLPGDPTSDNEAATKHYIDNHGAAVGALVYKGGFDCSANPNYPAADAGHLYVVTAAGLIGGASGIAVDVGDELLCLVTGTSSGDQGTVGANWTIAQGNLLRAVSGPASAPADGDFAQFDGTTGRLVKDTGLSFDTDVTLATNSDARIASQKAIKTYVDSRAGNVVGPGAAIDSHFVQFNGTSGNSLKDGGVALDLDGSLTADSDARIASQKAIKTYVDATKLALSGGVLSGALGLPNGSAAAPALLFTHGGIFDDAANSGLGYSFGGVQAYFLTATGFKISLPGGATTFISLQSEGVSANFRSDVYNGTPTSAPAFIGRRASGTMGAPGVPVSGYALLNIYAAPFNGSGFSNGGQLQFYLAETAPVDASHLGTRLRLYLCAVGSGTLTNVAEFSNEAGLALFGVTAIDQNRFLRPRSTTVAGQIAPSNQGNIGYFSDGQNGNGVVVFDAGTVYRYAGQAGVQRLVDADATNTPMTSGRSVWDRGALTADRKLILANTNASDGYDVMLSRFGSTGGHNRKVYQADTTTLIATVADGGSAKFEYDVINSLWAQTR